MKKEKRPDSTTDQVFLVATIRPWNIDAYHSIIKHFEGEWHLITEENALTADTVQSLRPRYIFFPHWSQIVPKEILDTAECVCFHETDVPYGRGGSPIQNLIVRGHKDTVITALKMEEELDGGPVYMKRPLSLHGTAEEIFSRGSLIVAKMIGDIAKEQPTPTPQKGDVTTFKRRTPRQSEITQNISDMSSMYDHIRMLDAPEYPHAYLNVGNFRITFSNANWHTDSIDASVRITKRKDHD